MKLYKQLLIVLTAIFVVLSCITMIVQVRTDQVFLQQQQEVNVNNTINSLSLALIPYLESKDVVGAEALITSAFDGSFFGNIKLKIYSDNTVIEKSTAISVKPVPNILYALNLFSVNKLTTNITSGWLQLGELTIEANPYFAYQQLWTSSRSILLWYSLVFILTLIVTQLILQKLLQPLKEIEAQAIKIENHQFDKISIQPKTIEFSNLVSSINKLTSKLEYQFNEEAENAKQLKNKIYIDAPTKLGNRTHFMNRANDFFAAERTGLLAVIQVTEIEARYRRKDFSEKNMLLGQIGQLFITMCEANAEMICARISNEELVVLLPDIENSNTAVQFCDELYAKLDKTIRADQSVYIEPIAIGATILNSNSTLTDAMTKADQALRKSSSEKLPYYLLDDAIDFYATKFEIRDMLIKALASDGFNHSLHAVTLMKDNQLFHHELYTGLKVNNKHVNAGQFISIVETFNLGVEFDLHNIHFVINKINDLNQSHAPIAINLTHRSVTSSDFLNQIKSIFENKPILAQSIMFEVSERTIHLAPEAAFVFIDACNHLGIQWGIDQFGAYLGSYEFLKSNPPAYVKLEPTLMVQLQENDEQSVLRALSRTAHNVYATVVGTRIETNESLPLLEGLFIDAYQGRIIPSINVN